MNIKALLPISIVVRTSTTALHLHGHGPTSTALRYQNYPLVEIPMTSEKTTKMKKAVASTRRRKPEASAGDVEWTDVDGDRRFVQTPEARQASLRKPAAVNLEKSSSIIGLSSIDDYHLHVLQNPHQLHIVRFSAPWCQVCRTTNVAWERMASRIKRTSSAVQFLSVVVDGDGDVKALRDMLQINKVPMGVVHCPAEGVFGARIDMHRTNLSALKKNLERYLTLTRDEDGLQSGMLLDGLRKRKRERL